MKALVLTSTSFRHRYFAQQISRHFEVPAVLAEAKRNYYSQQKEESALVRRHFDAIAEAEQRWFGHVDSNQGPQVISVPGINAEEWVTWAKEQGVDVLCLFGTAILGKGWLEAFPDRIVNLHLGLSPFYRGSATLFWPFVNRELQYLGTTIHLAIAKVDAGAILARVDADLQAGEDYYDITNHLIRDSIDRFPQVVADFMAGRIAPFAQEAIAGRLYRKADFNEAVLAQALAYAGKGLEREEINRIEELRACRYSQ